MKKILLFILFFLSLAASAQAIVIVPPVIYIATLSILSLIFNLLIGFFFWLAVQTVIFKGPGAAKGIQLVEGSISILGKIVPIFLLIFFMEPLFDVSSLFGILFFALIITLILTFFLLLSHFRDIRNTLQKVPLLQSLLFSILFIFLITTAAVFFSVSFNAVYSNPSTPSANDAAGIAASSPSTIASDSTGYGKATDSTDAARSSMIVSEFWLTPTSSAPCVLSYSDQVLSFTPVKSCYQKTAQGFIRSFCPIKVSASQIQADSLTQLEESGSCSGSFLAQSKNGGLELLNNE